MIRSRASFTALRSGRPATSARDAGSSLMTPVTLPAASSVYMSVLRLKLLSWTPLGSRFSLAHDAPVVPLCAATTIPLPSPSVDVIAGVFATLTVRLWLTRKYGFEKLTVCWRSGVMVAAAATMSRLLLASDVKIVAKPVSTQRTRRSSRPAMAWTSSTSNRYLRWMRLFQVAGRCQPAVPASHPDGLLASCCLPTCTGVAGPATVAGGLTVPHTGVLHG